MDPHGDILDRVAQSVCAQLLRKLDGSGDSWSYFDLTRPSVDPMLRKVFTLRYEELFVTERRRLVQGAPDAALRYESEAVTKQVTSLIDELKRNLMVEKRDVESLLFETVLGQVRFIVMPLKTVEEGLYAENAARSVSDIVSRFRSFDKYRYYPDALEKYAHAKSIQHLTRGQLHLLITEINQSLFGTDGLENVLKVSGLIMKELNDLQGRASGDIEIPVLMMAFADRSLRDFEVALNIEKELGKERINAYGLRQVLNRFALLKEKKGVPPPPPVSSEEPASARAEEKRKPKDTTDVIIDGVLQRDESGELIDLHQVLSQQGRNAPLDEAPADEPMLAESPEGEPAPSPLEPPSDVTGEFIREELVESFSDDTAAIKLLALKQADRLVSIETLISDKDEKIFLKRIFMEDVADYRGFLKHLNRTKTWKEAINVLDDKLYSNKVDPYCKEAIRLSDIVYTRFYPPEPAEPQN